MLTDQTTIKTEIANERQRWIDEPVYETIAVREEFRSRVAMAIAAMFKTKLPKDVEVLTGYKRFILQWIESDGNGGTKIRGK